VTVKTEADKTGITWHHVIVEMKPFGAHIATSLFPHGHKQLIGMSYQALINPSTLSHYRDGDGDNHYGDAEYSSFASRVLHYLCFIALNLLS
jgi:hypothetical protein